MFDFSVDMAKWNERNHGGVILIIGILISVANECYSFLGDCSFVVDCAYNLRDEERQVGREKKIKGRMKKE